MKKTIPLTSISTFYNGTLYRSRLEARWAIFFDSLSLSYTYEPRRYYLGKEITYLPDFWLSSFNCFVEIKGKHPIQVEIEKARRLSYVTNAPTYIFYGDIPNPYNKISKEKGAILFAPYINKRGAAIITGGGGYRFVECPYCHAVTIDKTSSYASDCAACDRHNFAIFEPMRLMDAYNKAIHTKFL